MCGAFPHSTSLPSGLGVVQDYLRQVLGVYEGQLVGPDLLGLLGVLDGVPAIVCPRLGPHLQQQRQLLGRVPLGLERDGQQVAREAFGRHLGVVLAELLERRVCGGGADLLRSQRDVGCADCADGGE